MEDKKIRIGKAAEILGMSVQTLRNWEKTGKLLPQRSQGWQRYYFLQDLERFALDLEKLGLAWAASAQPPEIPTDYYCEQQARFMSRLEKMGLLLAHADTVGEKAASLLTTVAGEIGDNSFMHNIGSWPDIPGIFFAYDIGKRVIVLADRGQGVRKTLSRVRPNIKTDVEALRVAFTEIVSGREPEKRGNGLKVVRRIIELNPIYLLFRSGVAAVKSPKKQSGSITIAAMSENVRGAYAIIKF
ncbi:MAG: MerR family DNA-binding transcriptional regulator [Candidatus Niyogibacteria bacterium]|nr:MerR family DNA-binding transcriptional regulator [Candidatus Niyogibacteria bacterium]